MCRFVIVRFETDGPNFLKSPYKVRGPVYKCPTVFKGYSWSFIINIIAMQKCVKLVYLMTAMLIMGKYFSYVTARAVSRAVMQVEKILSHLSEGKETTFLTPRPVVNVTLLTADE